MKKTYSILKREKSNVSNWSGGTTEEIYIYPRKAQYGKMNFFFRLSLATVETPESVFTPLPNIYRTTLILEGELTLDHAEEYTKTLTKFKQDSYPGDWTTKSAGNSTNFNLMTRGKAKGEVEAFQLEEGEQIARPTSKIALLYVHKGSLAVVLGKDAIVLDLGDTLEITGGVSLIVAKALEESEVILTSVVL